MSEDYKKFSKVKFEKSFKDVFVSDYDGKGVFVPLKLMTATWDKNKDHIVDKIGILVDGKTLDGIYYKDARNRNKDRPCGGIKFDTLEEAKAFVEYTESTYKEFSRYYAQYVMNGNSFSNAFSNNSSKNINKTRKMDILTNLIIKIKKLKINKILIHILRM